MLEASRKESQDRGFLRGCSFRVGVPISPSVKYVFLVLIVLSAFLQGPAFAQVAGVAQVQPDASLVVDGRRLVLADIELLDATRTCDPNIPLQLCGAPAAIALRARVVHEVSCRLRADIAGLQTAVCRHADQFPAGGEDLAAFLIAEGWAKAGPDAPPLYRTLETIARSHGRGAWGPDINQLINPQPQ